MEHVSKVRPFPCTAYAWDYKTGMGPLAVWLILALVALGLPLWVDLVWTAGAYLAAFARDAMALLLPVSSGYRVIRALDGGGLYVLHDRKRLVYAVLTSGGVHSMVRVDGTKLYSRNLERLVEAFLAKEALDKNAEKSAELYEKLTTKTANPGALSLVKE